MPRKKNQKPRAELPADNPERLIFGRKAVLDLLRSEECPVEAVYAAQTAHLNRELEEQLNKAQQAGIPIYSCSREQFETISRGINDQGVAALLKQPRIFTPADISRRGLREGASGVILILDELTDPHNIGSVMRAAEAAGADGVLLTRKRSAAMTAAARRVSSGASEIMPFAYLDNLQRAVESLKKEGYWIIGAALSEDAKPLFSADIPLPAAVILGAEGKGLRLLTRKLCDVLIEIPMQGRIQSLNVGQAAAVVLFELVRRRLR